MPVLRDIRARFEKERPLDGLKIAACLHVTSETANLMRALKAGGASVVLCASNPLSTQDDTAAALVSHYGIDTLPRRGVDTDGYYAHLEAALDTRPNITMDDGCDLVTLLHTKRRDQLAEVTAGTEETTTGVSGFAKRSARGRWPTRSSRSTTPRPSTCSTTATAPASRPSTASCGPPTCSWPARPSWSPGSATAARAWPCAPAASG